LRALNKKSPTTRGRGARTFIVASNVAAPAYARAPDSCKPMEVYAMPPLALTDSELDAVFDAARPLPVEASVPARGRA
jgi:hypothetical protein